MKTGTALVTTIFTLASFPLLAQQPPPASQPNSPATRQSTPSSEPAQPMNSPAASPESAVQMSPVKGELVSKLDSKTAKTGDSVVVQTKASAKTADGTEIPKGSKLVGHVVGVQPSGAGDNSQVVLQFDHLELKGGQSMAVHSQIESIAPPPGAGGAMSEPQAGGAPQGAGGAPQSAGGAPQGAGGYPGAAPAGNSGPAAGTVVARNGNIAISTTSIPGVLVANNAPGQQDPRMAQASSILLGAKKDIQLDGGTQMVVGLSAAGAGAQ
jgi:hypothetical protein